MERVKIDVERVLSIHMVFDGEQTKGWVHTHGMNKFGHPELEVRGVSPVFLMPMVGNLLNNIADYMLNTDNKVIEGHKMTVGPFTFRFMKLEPIPGDEEHYVHPHLALTDLEVMKCAHCSMEDHEEHTMFDDHGNPEENLH